LNNVQAVPLHSDLYDHPALYDSLLPARSHIPYYVDLARRTWYVSAPGKPDAWVLPMVLRSIFPQELPLLLAVGGFHLASRFGDLSQQPFGPASPLHVCLCQAKV